MNQIAVFLLLLVNKALTYITYDFGNYTKFDYNYDSNFQCKNSATYTKTITFSGAFENVPQFVIFPYYYDMDYLTLNEFTFTISSITTTKITFVVKCIQKYRLYVFMFNWAAIDDQRVEVISSLNTNVTNVASKSFTFSHNNINAMQGVVTQTSFGFKGSITYQLQISSITTDQVTVSYTTSNTNLMSIGFQIILGTPEAFTQSLLIQQTSLTKTSYYNSGTLTIPTGTRLLLPLTALSYTTSENVRLYQCYYTTSTTISYTFQPWGVSTFNYLYHQQVWFNIQNTKVLKPFQLKKIRVSKKLDFTLDSDLIKLQISELSLTFTQVLSQSILINKEIQTLNLIFTFQCSPGKKIQGSVFQCPSCSQQSFQISQNCYSGINVIKYFITLYQQNQIYQKIQLDVSESGFTISESVINQQGSSSYSIMTLSIVNQ